MKTVKGIDLKVGNIVADVENKDNQCFFELVEIREGYAFCFKPLGGKAEKAYIPKDNGLVEFEYDMKVDDFWYLLDEEEIKSLKL